MENLRGKMEKTTKPETALILALVFVFIMMLGITSNFLVMYTNGGRMPALYDVYTCDSTGSIIHYIEESGKLNFTILADVIDSHIPKIGIFSIGDVFLTVGYLGMITFLIRFTILKRRK